MKPGERNGNNMVPHGSVTNAVYHFRLQALASIGTTDRSCKTIAFHWAIGSVVLLARNVENKKQQQTSSTRTYECVADASKTAGTHILPSIRTSAQLVDSTCRFGSARVLSVLNPKRSATCKKEFAEKRFMLASLVSLGNGNSNARSAAKPKPPPNSENRKPNRRKRRSVSVADVKRVPSADNISKTFANWRSMLPSAQHASTTRACFSVKYAINKCPLAISQRARFTTDCIQHKLLSYVVAAVMHVEIVIR